MNTGRHIGILAAATLALLTVQLGAVVPLHAAPDAPTGPATRGARKSTPRKPRPKRITHTPRSTWKRFAGKVVRSIRFKGMKRTRAARLRHFLDTRTGKRFDPARFAEDMRRIRNMELFRPIRVNIQERTDGLHITFYMKDKWSLLPYFNFVRGGGSYQIVMGVYDVNVLGCLFMLDLMFIVFDGKPAGVIYGHIPRIWGIPLDAWLSGGWAKSIRSVYGARTVTEAIYLTDTRWFDLTLRSEPVPWFRGSVWQQFLWRTYKYAEDSPLKLFEPKNGRIIATGITLSFGKLRYSNYMMHGIRLDVSLSGSFKALKANVAYLKASWNFRAYWKFGPRGGNLAGRLRGGYISGGSLEDEFTMGSFQGLRGFQYAQFLGRAYVGGNFEYRTGLLPMEFPVMSKVHRVFRGKSLRFQGVVFTDLGAIAGSRNHYLGADYISHGGRLYGSDYLVETGKLLWSVGAGVRIAFVPFYKAVLRIDAAYTLSPFRTWDIIIATQQYF